MSADRRTSEEIARFEEIERAATSVCETFEREQAQGDKGRDKEFAVFLLRKALGTPKTDAEGVRQ